MVLTTSFSSPLRTLEAARTEEAGPSLVGQALGSPGPSGLAARTSSGDLEQVSGAAAGLLRPGTCFESRREARWGRRGGGGAASRAAAAREGSISSAARARGGRGPSSAPPIPPRPRPGSRPRSPARAGGRPRPPASRLRASPALTPGRPRPGHPVGAGRGKHIMAIEGKWRPTTGREEGERSGSGGSAAPRGRGTGGAVSWGREAG